MSHRDVLRIAVVWAAWLGAILVTVAIGLAAGAYHWSGGWYETHGIYPLFAWDYNLYRLISDLGYPAHRVGQEYAFFPLWPVLLRAVENHWDATVAIGLAWASSAAAFFGIALGPPRARLHSVLALACWPGSFALAIAYPDALALAAAVWAAALALRGRPVAAGVLGAVAAVARPNGVLIALPLLWLGRRRVSGWIGAALPVAAAAGVEAYFWARSDHARAFFDAQKLWGRDGPAKLGDWADHVLAVIDRHGSVIGPLALAAGAALYVAWRRFGAWPTAIGAYACAVPLLLAATRSLEGFVDSARAALVLPLLVLLWRLGPRYRPWAAFATVVVGLLLLSGTIQSFGRQSLFAFPIFWAIADGPRLLRSPLLAGLGFAANLALVLLLTRFAP
ncbi:MAG TPA: hypothetical protein VKB10_12170 [Gaiellaceae bacterium]|nr:hypothetical protein [Gaiellaceae bacterium]